MSFTGKVVIVTGAASGIGAATVKAFTKEGAKVTLVDKDEAKLTEVAKQCEQHENKALVIKADITKEEDVKMIVKKTVEVFGKLDVLVNNAGLGRNAYTIFDNNLMEDYDLIMDVNLRSVVHLTHLAVPHLIKTKGNVVNTSSVCAVRSFAGKPNLVYSVSKAGVDHFTRSVALDLAPHGVRVNAVNPGPTMTAMIENADSWKNYTAFKKLSEPEEVADVILFLANDKARSITGSTYSCDNGSHLI